MSDDSQNSPPPPPYSALYHAPRRALLHVNVDANTQQTPPAPTSSAAAVPPSSAAAVPSSSTGSTSASGRRPRTVGPNIERIRNAIYSRHLRGRGPASLRGRGPAPRIQLRAVAAGASPVASSSTSVPAIASDPTPTPGIRTASDLVEGIQNMLHDDRIGRANMLEVQANIQAASSASAKLFNDHFDNRTLNAAWRGFQDTDRAEILLLGLQRVRENIGFQRYLRHMFPTIVGSESTIEVFLLIAIVHLLMDGDEDPATLTMM